MQAKMGSQDNTGKAAYFSSRSLLRSRKYKRGGKKEVVRPKMVKKANTEPQPRPCDTDGLLASSLHTVKKGCLPGPAVDHSV